MALAEDHAALTAIKQAASLANPADRAALRAHPEAMDLPLARIERGLVHLAERYGNPVGFAVAVPAGENIFELEGLFVDPAHWRAGIGSALIDRACQAAAGARAVALTVITSAEAQQFYEANGFAVDGPMATRFGPAVAMRRGLVPAKATTATA